MLTWIIYTDQYRTWVLYCLCFFKTYSVQLCWKPTNLFNNQWKRPRFVPGLVWIYGFEKGVCFYMFKLQFKAVIYRAFRFTCHVYLLESLNYHFSCRLVNYLCSRRSGLSFSVCCSYFWFCVLLLLVVVTSFSHQLFSLEYQ